MRKLSSYEAEARRRAEDDRDLRSRSDARRERKSREGELLALARALIAATPRQLAKLDLDPSLLAVLAEARRITSGSARLRVERLVRSRLRDEDLELLRPQLAELTGSPSRGGQ